MYLGYFFLVWIEFSAEKSSRHYLIFVWRQCLVRLVIAHASH